MQYRAAGDYVHLLAHLKYYKQLQANDSCQAK